MPCRSWPLTCLRGLQPCAQHLSNHRNHKQPHPAKNTLPQAKGRKHAKLPERSGASVVLLYMGLFSWSGSNERDDDASNIILSCWSARLCLYCTFDSCRFEERARYCPPRPRMRTAQAATRLKDTKGPASERCPTRQSFRLQLRRVETFLWDSFVAPKVPAYRHEVMTPTDCLSRGVISHFGSQTSISDDRFAFREPRHLEATTSSSASASTSQHSRATPSTLPLFTLHIGSPRVSTHCLGNYETL